MRNLRSSLPPLATLTTFEAAARHLSFTRAAHEMSVTQAAVSRQIKLLEESLGVLLFQRSHRAVALTAEGRSFQQTVTLALTHLANSTAELRRPAKPASLCVATDQSVASLWLMPRLPSFRERHADIAPRLVVSDLEADCLTEDVDVAIVHGEGRWPGFDAEMLLEEEVFPVCSPEYLLTHGATLSQATLLDLESEHWNWLTWRMWLTETGIELEREAPRIKINSYPLVIQAARDGQGIALGWRYLVDPLIAAGALIRPVEESVCTRYGYYLLSPQRAVTTDHARTFRRWVQSVDRSAVD